MLEFWHFARINFAPNSNSHISLVFNDYYIVLNLHSAACETEKYTPNTE